MFENELEKIENDRQNKLLVTVVWTIIKLVIAILIVSFIDYGMFIVIGYILYSLEHQSGLHYLNSQETNYHINELYNKDAVELGELKKEFSVLKEQLEDYELRLEVFESNGY